ncbi:MAG: tetratricopeptide repeat protein [Planctomycetota bacterium]
MNEQVLQLENESEQLKAEGKNEEAIAKLTEALAIDESFVRIHLALSVLYTKTEDFDKACAHAEKAVELEPGDAFNMAALSVTYQRAFEGTRDQAYIQKAEEALARGHGMG